MVTEPQAPLDDVAGMQAVDSRDMRRLIRELPEQCETALGIARSFVVEPEEVGPTAVLLMGVRDSRLAADMAAAVLAGESAIPVIACQGDRLPAFVNEDTLVYIIDYTGKSQMQIKNLRDAKRKGARVICLTSGGALLQAAVNEEVPILKVPPGQPGRTAIGYLFIPLVATIEKFGLVQGPLEHLGHAIKLMKNVREMFRVENPTHRNLAKQTAETLFGKTVAIYGVPGYRAAVAERWKRQIACNSKSFAMTAVFPDVASGEITGWESMKDQGDSCAVVILRDQADKGPMAELVDVTVEASRGYNVIQIQMRGATTMEKLLYGMYLGDYVSYYLAILGMVDPTKMELVSVIEKRLSEPEPPAATEAEEQSETPETGGE